MRVLLLAQFLPPVTGGEERHVWNLARALASRSHEITLLGFATDDEPAGESVTEGVRVVRCRTTASRLPVLYSDPSRPHALPIPDPEVSRAVRRELESRTYDVIHAHNWIVNSALGPAAAAGVPVVMTLHDYSHICATKRMMERGERKCAGPSVSRCLPCSFDHYGAANGAVTSLANAWMSRRRLRLLAETAAVSSAVASAVAVPSGGWMGRSGLTSRVIPNFIPDELVLKTIPDTAADAPLLFAGDLSRDKGVQVLLDAYARLESAPPLVLVGRSADPDSWTFPTGATWLGSRTHEEVMDLFRSARAVIVPSVWDDPCPTVVLEAMAAGRPVVAARSGGIVDMVVDGHTGRLVEPGDVTALADAIAEVLADPERARRMGTAGRDRAREFTITAVVDRIEQLYIDHIGTARIAAGR